MSPFRLLGPGLALLVVSVLVPAAAATGLATPAAPTAATAAKATRWAPPDRAQIHPGVQMYTRGAQCTGNFVFTDRRDRVYVGYAAHCAGLGEATDLDGCHADTRPLGTPVSFRKGGNVVEPGTKVGDGRLAYSSWVTMQRLGLDDPVICNLNDFALVRVAARHAGKVNPTMPSWGGPTGIDTNGAQAGDQVWTYGASSLLLGETVLSPRTGLTLADDPAYNGWTHALYSLPPGVPGDSGSGFLSEGGKAIGVLSTLGILPMAGSNNITDLGKALAFAQEHSGIPGLRLVRGTRPFSG